MPKSLPSLHSSKFPNHAVNHDIRLCFLKPLFCLRKLLRLSTVSYPQTLWWLCFASDQSLPGLILEFSEKEKLLAPAVRNPSQSTLASHQLSCSEKSTHRTLCSKHVFCQEDPVCPVCVFIFWFKNMMCGNLATKFLVQVIFPASLATHFAHFGFMETDKFLSKPQVFWTDRDVCRSSLGGHLREHFHQSRLAVVRELAIHRTLLKPVPREVLRAPCVCLSFLENHAVWEPNKLNFWLKPHLPNQKSSLFYSP